MYDYAADVLEVKDGDTIRLRVDQGFGNAHAPKAGFRFNGLDCPEKGDKRPAVRKKALKAMEFVAARLGVPLPGHDAKAEYLGATLGPAVVRVLTYKPEPREKFGRLQMDLFYIPLGIAGKKKADDFPPPPAAPWRFLNLELLESGLAKPYKGGKRVWTDEGT